VFASVCLSIWSVSASKERSRVAAAQNLLVQLGDMIEWLAGPLPWCVLSVAVSATLAGCVFIALVVSVSLSAPVLFSASFPLFFSSSRITMMPVHFNLIEMLESSQTLLVAGVLSIFNLVFFKKNKEIVGFPTIVKSSQCLPILCLWLCLSQYIFLSPGPSPRLKLY
jgi:hypothetical protein